MLGKFFFILGPRRQRLKAQFSTAMLFSTLQVLTKLQLLLPPIHFKFSTVIHITGRHRPLCKMQHWHCKSKFRKTCSKCLSNASIVFGEYYISPYMAYCVKLIQIFCIHSHKNGVFGRFTTGKLLLASYF